MAGVAEEGRVARLAGRPVLEADGVVYRWDDAVRAAELRGELAELERETSRALAALARDGAPTSEEVSAAGAAFRYARGLLSADELEAWLARWELTVTDWLDHLRRALARERLSGSAPQSLPPADEAAVWVDAVCSGALERWARALAARIAVAPGAPVDEALEARFERFCADVQSDEALAREIDAHRLEWMRIEGEQLALGDEDVAREVAFCVREEGAALAELAGPARGDLAPIDAYFVDLEPELAAALLGGREGELVGPLALGERFVVARLERKEPPSRDDPRARARAGDLVLTRALAREIEKQVRWHEQL